MKKYFRVGVVLLLVLGSVALVFADIRETQRERGGSDLQNVHDRVLCVDGFKVFQTIVFGFVKDGGAAVSNSGHLLENIIFLHLRPMTESLYYYRTSNGKEIDFVWLDGQKKKHIVQVCLSMADPMTKKRDMTSLVRAMDELSLTEATIVTLDEDQQMEKDGKKIRIIPAWKFLVMND